MNHRRFYRTLLVLALLVPWLSVAAYGQVTKGSINGTVTDPDGALVPGAAVTAKNTATGVTQRTVVSGDGTYAITNLDPGMYDVTVEAKGFSTKTFTGVVVSVAFPVTLNAPLALGELEETVEVTATAEAQINLTDQQVSTLIDRRRINDLPLLGRDPYQLVLLSPGTVQSNSDLGGFSVNGQRERNNNFLVDGIDNNDAEVPGIAGGATTINVDATEEFRVITGNYSAEYGRNTGAIVNIITRGGTNEFHGGAYWFGRYAVLGARNFFDASGKEDPLVRNQFGFKLGGPVRRNSTFFFGNYEGDRFRQGFQFLRQVPSQAARQGVFTDARFGLIDLRPGSRSNRLNLELNPAMLEILSLYPQGNDPASDPVPGIVEAYRFTQSLNLDGDQVNVRVDHQLTSNHQLSFSYSLQNSPDLVVDGDLFPGLGGGILSPQRGQRFSGRVASSFTQTLINEFRFGFNRIRAPFLGDTEIFDQKIASIFQKYGIPSATFGTGNGAGINLVFPQWDGFVGFDDQARYAGTTTVGDTLTWVRNTHTLKGGVEFRPVYSNSFTNFGRRETLTVNAFTNFGRPYVRTSTGGIVPAGGAGAVIHDVAAALYGLLGAQTQSQYFNAAKQRTEDDLRGFRSREFEWFVEDSWKVKPYLTLNYGVRWEFRGVPYEVNNQLSTLIGQDPSGFAPFRDPNAPPEAACTDPNEPACYFTFTIVGPGTGHKLYSNDLNNWGPRVGFAWDVFKDGKTSLRGGYGIFYDRIFGNLFNNARGNPPFQQDFFNGAIDLPSTRPTLAELQAIQAQAIPRPPTQTPSEKVFNGALVFPVFFADNGSNTFQDHFVIPYTQHWSLNLQRELFRHLVLEAGYIGTKGTGLLRVVDGNRVSVTRVNQILGQDNGIADSFFTNFQNGTLNTAFFNTALNANQAFSIFHSMQLRVTKAFANGWSVQGAYTVGKSIDSSEDPLVATQGNRSFPRDSNNLRAERGLSGFDTRQRLVVNFLWEVPKTHFARALGRVLNGWQLSGIVQVQGGNPYSVFGNIDSVGSSLNQRLDYNGGLLRALPGSDRTLTGAPLASFDLPPSGSGRQGTTGRNPGYLIGPGFAQTDFSIFKLFPITETHRLQFRAEFFNLFNQVNFNQPGNLFQEPAQFGRSTQAALPRTVQFALKYDF